MSFQLALYKGTRPGLQGLYSRAVRFVDDGPYSHCELVFSDGVSASSSFIDGGVRFKRIDFKPGHWDFVDLPGHLEPRARWWFDSYKGAPYDLAGNLSFLMWFWPQDERSWFCSEAIGAALGIEDPFRLGPNGLGKVIRSYQGFFSAAY